MRQYLASEMPDKNGVLAVTGKDFKYLSQVLRLEPGDEVWVRLPDQQLILMEVMKLQSKQLIFAHSEKQDSLQNVEKGVTSKDIKKSGVEYWIFQFIPKQAKMDLIIRQCVECGVSNIVPVKGEFSNSNDWKNRQERWERLLKEARQQSGSPVDTKITEAKTLTEAIVLWKENLVVSNSNTEKDWAAFVMHEADLEDKSIFQVLKGIGDKLKKVVIAIGPEGGMSAAEVNILSNAGFNLIHFDTNVLRCETACLYGIAAVQTAISEYDVWHTKE